VKQPQKRHQRIAKMACRREAIVSLRKISWLAINKCHLQSAASRVAKTIFGFGVACACGAIEGVGNEEEGVS